MSCCPDINDIFTGFSPVSYENLTNVIEVDGELFRSGGVVGTNDAHAQTVDWVDGDSCAMWVWTVENAGYPPDDYESNELLYYIFPEDGSTGVYGWYFTNNLASFRRSPILNSGFSFPIYYRNIELGYNRFAIYYNNGLLWLLETSEIGTADPGWIGPPSYAAVGLPTTTRWKLYIQTRADALLGHSSAVTQYIGSPAPCGTAVWSLPPLVWTATGTVTTAPPPPAVNTMTFDNGLGNDWFIAGQVIDSGNELRSKTLKDPHVTGRVTNANVQLYAYDIADEVNVSDLENGTNATAERSVPDSTGVAQSPKRNMQVKNAVLSTVRLEGNDSGNEERDEVHEIVVQQAIQGVRR